MATAGSYPVRFDVPYPGRFLRWMVLVKWLLAAPHYVLLRYAFGPLQLACSGIAFFWILFTERYPRGLFDLWVGTERWNAQVGAYIGLMRDEYPPFSWAPGAYPVTYEVDYPDRLSRWLIFVKWLLLVPHYIVLLALWIAALVGYIIAFFAILFTQQFPRGLFDFLVGVDRWTYRVVAYFALLRDEYPPFGLS
jgi:hypothetical protein